MLVHRHMDRLGGVERLHEQIYSAVTTGRRESLNLALMGYGNAQPFRSAPCPSTCQKARDFLCPDIEALTASVKFIE